MLQINIILTVIFSILSLTNTSVMAATSIPVGTSPTYSVVIDGKLYVNTSGGLSIIDTATDQVVDTLPLDPNHTRFMINIDKKLYVLNNNAINNAAGTVTVINTATNETKTLTVGVRPIGATVVGHKVYVLNGGSSSLSLISFIDDSVKTVTLGAPPVLSALVGAKLYVYHNVFGESDPYISIIDPHNDTNDPIVGRLSGYRWLAYMPYNDVSIFGAVGTKLYAARLFFDRIFILDTTKVDQLISNSPTPNPLINTDHITDPSINPFEAQVMIPSVYTLQIIGKEIFMTSTSGQITVIDTESPFTVNQSHPLKPRVYERTSTFPGNMSYAGRFRMVNKKIYMIELNTVKVIDALNHSPLSTIPVGNNPQYLTVVGEKLYVSNSSDTTLSVIDTKTDTVIDFTKIHPQLLKFSSSTANGVYSAGKIINITAHFDEALVAGSTLTVALNTGATVILNALNDKTLSGNYTVRPSDAIADLAITSITNASVSNGTNTRTQYDLPYTPGNLIAENSKITRNLGDTKNIAMGEPLEIMNVGRNPYGIVAVNVNNANYLYVANQGEGTVTVIRASDHHVIKTIPVGNEPYGLTWALAANGKKYVIVANIKDNSVSIIDTTSNVKVSDINVGIKPYYVEKINNKVYVTNSISNSVSVIDINTMTAGTPIPVRTYPRAIKAYKGQYLYLANYGDRNYDGGNTVSVINTQDNNTVKTIYLPVGSAGPRGVAIIEDPIIGDRVYVTNFLTNNVSVIDALTNTVIDINPLTTDMVDGIPVGKGPRGIVAVGTKLYVENFDDSTMSIIDTTTTPPQVIKTMPVGNAPSGMAGVGNELYFSNFQDNNVLILDTVTNTLKPMDISSLLNNFVSAYTKTVGTLVPPTTSSSTATTLTVTFPTINTPLHLYQIQGGKYLINFNNIGTRISGTGSLYSFNWPKSTNVTTLRIYDLFDTDLKLRVDKLLATFGINLADGNLTDLEISNLKSLDNQILFDGFDANGKPVLRNATLFFSVLRKAALLDMALTPYTAADFSNLFGLSPTNVKDYSQALLTVAREEDYKQETFLNTLPNASLLFSALKNNTVNKSSFEEFFSITLPNSFALSNSMSQEQKNASITARKVLFQIAGEPTFNINAFANKLPLAKSLLTSLRSNSALMADFKNLYDLTVLAGGTPSPDLRNELFGVATDFPNQNHFLQYLLPEASGHLTNLLNSPIGAYQFYLDHNIPFETDYTDGNTTYKFDPISKKLTTKIFNNLLNTSYSLDFTADGNPDHLIVKNGIFKMPNITINSIDIEANATVVLGEPLSETELRFISATIPPSKRLREVLFQEADLIIPTPAQIASTINVIPIDTVRPDTRKTLKKEALPLIAPASSIHKSASFSRTIVNRVQISKLTRNKTMDLPKPTINHTKTEIILDYKQALSDLSDPRLSDFDVTVNGSEVELSSSSIKGSSIILTLKNEIKYTDQVKVNYSP